MAQGNVGYYNPVRRTRSWYRNNSKLYSVNQALTYLRRKIRQGKALTESELVKVSALLKERSRLVGRAHEDKHDVFIRELEADKTIKPTVPGARVVLLAHDNERECA